MHQGAAERASAKQLILEKFGATLILNMMEAPLTTGVCNHLFENWLMLGLFRCYRYTMHKGASKYDVRKIFGFFNPSLLVHIWI